jgi:hypothetical protein
MKQRLEATFRNQKMLDENLLSGTNSQFVRNLANRCLEDRIPWI